MLCFLRPQTAYAATDETANLVAIQFIQVHAGILQRLPGGVNTQLCEAVGPTHFLRVWKSRCGIEVLNLRSDLAREIADIKRGHAVDAAFTVDDVLPE